MDRRRRTPAEAAAARRNAAVSPPSSPPSPSISPNLFRDVSNYKTPYPSFRNPNPISPSPLPLFFTASKNAPSSSTSSTNATSTFRRRPSSSAAAASRRLKALELEQSKSSHKAQICREKALKSFSRSLTSWLNLLFSNPRACGCDLGVPNREDDVVSRGKRESLEGEREMGVGGQWRGPKRRRDGVEKGRLSSAMYAYLEVSLKDVCSLEDVKERMERYMSREGCRDVLLMMYQVCKNIDNGRLKMKVICPIATDLRLKEKSTRVLMCYNPVWLRIGLHIVLGGDSVLQNEKRKGEQEDLFIKMIIEKQLFSHMGIAKAFSYSKLVEGLHRPGYFESLGNIILKRLLLLVSSLDRAKTESSLPVNYGIDGVDGGSAPLFCCHSHIKSSRQIIYECLAEVMHGEGDLLSHLTILGFKLSYQQFPLSEYDFTIRNLFEDLQDGILLCRATQLLLSEASLISKLITPCDTHKKKIQNCTVALQYLKKAGVLLSDGDGIVIEAEDITNADKELILSLLWNMFTHLQLPLLVERSSLVGEITRLKSSDMDLLKYNTMTHTALLLEWIQVVYSAKAESPSSLLDGDAICCLINYYLNINHHGFSLKENQNGYTKELNKCLYADSSIAICKSLAVHRISELPSDLLKILPLSDILDNDASMEERSVIILLAFLFPQLINSKKMDHLRKTITRRSEYQSPGIKLTAISQTPISSSGSFRRCSSQGKNEPKCVSSQNEEEQAAMVIQCHIRKINARTKFLKMKIATSLLQSAIRAWLAVTLINKFDSVNGACSVLQALSGNYYGYFRFMMERHYFVRTKKSVLLIQKAVRVWIARRQHNEGTEPSQSNKFSDNLRASTYMQSYNCGGIASCRSTSLNARFQSHLVLHDDADILQRQKIMAAKTIQLAWKRYVYHKILLEKISAAVRIQSQWHGYSIRRCFISQVQAVIDIQATVRCFLCRKAFKRCHLATIVIQRFARGWLARKKLLGAYSLQSDWQHLRINDMYSAGSIKSIELKIVLHSILMLQRWWKQVLSHRSRMRSAILIQSAIRGWISRRDADKLCCGISIIQRWWRNFLFLKSQKRSVLIIQAYVRGWIARRAAVREKKRIVVIQSYCKGYLARKHSKQQVSDLRYRLQKCAANVDDGMRLINRLVAAVSQLLACRSISSIRQTCATLSIASAHSQKCCETLVAAGAVEILLKQIHSLNRGIPDQEVLKHVLSTLRNISQDPKLLQVLIDTPQSVEIIFQELLRNKTDGFSIACDLLKKLCAVKEGLEATRKLYGHVRRLSILAQALERKIELDKRTARLGAGRDLIAQRHREATDLLVLIVDSRQ
ncbi:uncharacterized protein [Typha angustifolia]|uniref:uncharacterized protein isoform X1 n=1 Tax=Typha angustifolia TaxID=59011 RepID=UPI003C307D68